MNFVRILGLNFPLLSRSELKAKALSLLNGSRASQIVTPNPEILLLADRDDEYMDTLRRADLLLPDGIGLVLAARFKRARLHRLSGSDVMPDLLREAERKDYKVACFLWCKGLTLVHDLEEALRHHYPNLSFKIWPIEKDYDLPEDFAAFMPDLVLIGTGAPHQDKLAELIKANGLARLSIGVGGSFDFLSGRIKRAPESFRRWGLEWLWRLIKQPSRIGRILNAVAIFSCKFLIQECIHSKQYRPNVVGFIVGKDGRVLIVNSNKEPGRDFWKLPQGGRNYWESNETALRREMQEELGLVDLEILAQYQDIYQYDWPPQYSIRGYKGQRQSLFIARFNGELTAVKLNSENKDYAWVHPDNLLEATSFVTHRAYSLFLTKYKDLNR